MQRFFFDTRASGYAHIDDTGQVLLNKHAARVVALHTLPDLARDEMLDPGRVTDAFLDEDTGVVSITVRDERGEVVYSAELTLRGRWGPPEPAG